ncbi:MAG: MATE family efflux transporter [Paracoccaceae bacterium]
MMGWVGTVPLAAHGIALESAALTFMVHLGLSNAATVRVGRARPGRYAGLRDSASNWPWACYPSFWRRWRWSFPDLAGIPDFAFPEPDDPLASRSWPLAPVFWRRRRLFSSPMRRR